MLHAEGALRIDSVDGDALPSSASVGQLSLEREDAGDRLSVDLEPDLDV